MEADARALKEACRDFGPRYGVETFLDVMAGIMQGRLRDHGLAVHFNGTDGGAPSLRLPDVNESKALIPDKGA